MNMSLSIDSALATPGELESAGVALVATALNAVLADRFELHLETRNFRWHVSGPHFRDHDLPFDDQAMEIVDTADAITQRRTSPDNDSPDAAPRAMLAELRDDNLALVDAMLRAGVLTKFTKDDAASDVIDNWSDRDERRAWFLFEVSRQ